MRTEHIANAWRDEDYLYSLDDTTRSELPESPIGEIDLSDVDLEQVEGGSWSALSVATVSAVTALFCVSYVGGGTCQQGTSGCC